MTSRPIRVMSEEYHNTPARWVEYIRRSSAATSGCPNDLPWEEWLTDATTLDVPRVPDAVLELLGPEEVDAVHAQQVIVKAVPPAPLKMVSMEFKYLLCYGTDCWVDFRSLNGSVVCLLGACGRLAFFEIVCWAIFGEGIPTREVKSQSAAVVCSGRKPGERAIVSVVLDVGDVLFHIHRPLDVKESSSGASSGQATVSRCCVGPAVVVASGKSAVDAWVLANVGDLKTFLSTAMMTQHRDHDPVSQSGRALAEQIDGLMGNQAIADAARIVLRACEAHESLLVRLASEMQQAVYDRDGTTDTIDTYRGQLTERVAGLQWLHARLKTYRTWLMRTVVGPQIVQDVNRDLALLRDDDDDDDDGGSPLTLSGKWQDAKGMFVWEVSDGEHGSSPLGKAKGSQRATVTLCMRLALAPLTVVNTRSRHLFLDDEFTTGDQAITSRFAPFLASLRTRYDSVVVATHIPSLQEEADQELTITEYETLSGKVLSRLQHGRRGEAAPPAKKIGRPRKGHHQHPV